MATSELPDHAQSGPIPNAANIYEVVIKYRDRSTGVPLNVTFDPKDYKGIDGVVWNPVRLNALVAKTKEVHRPANPGELPNPGLAKKSEDQTDHSKKDVPEGTCCYINGAWICWR